MKPAEIRARYWALRSRMKEATTDAARFASQHEMELLQTEMMVELAAQQAEANEILGKFKLLNFEQLALQLDKYFREHEPEVPQ